MFLTIAIPIYNKEQYLTKCVDSILNQKEKNYEILLYDDGSTDNSLSICNDLKVKYPDYIRVLSNSNLGSIIARRKCIENAQGDYILIIDADDYFIDNKATEKIENTIKKYNIDLLIFNYTENNDLDKTLSFYEYPSQLIDDKEKLYHIATKDSSFLNPLFNKVFSRNIVDKEDYLKYSNVKNGTDYFQMLALLTNAKNIFYLKDVLYSYQIVNNSIAHSFNPGIYSSLKCGYERLTSLSRQWNITNKELFKKELIRKKMFICTTSAYKTRMCSIKNKKIAIEFLKEISNDDFFRDDFKKNEINEIGRARCLILHMLYRKQVKMLYYLIRIRYVVLKK